MFDTKQAGRKISILRKQNGLTQIELAELLFLSPQAISKWENGTTMPEVSVLVNLAEIFKCSVDDVLFIKDSFDKPNYEHVLLPYKPVSKYSGEKWPRGIA